MANYWEFLLRICPQLLEFVSSKIIFSDYTFNRHVCLGTGVERCAWFNWFSVPVFSSRIAEIYWGEGRGEPGREVMTGSGNGMGWNGMECVMLRNCYISEKGFSNKKRVVQGSFNGKAFYIMPDSFGRMRQLFLHNFWSGSRGINYDFWEIFGINWIFGENWLIFDGTLDFSFWFFG